MIIDGEGTKPVEVYVIVGMTAEGLRSKLISPPPWQIRRGDMRVIEYNKRVRTYTNASQARVYRKRLQNTIGGEYGIFCLRIHSDGTHESERIE